MPAVQRYQFREAEVVILSDGVSSFPSEFVMIGLDEQERLDACRRYGFEPNAVDSNMNVVYINGTAGSILFDTGAGMMMPGCGDLLESLAEAGIDPGSIDQVIQTHLHPDHIGWNVTADGAPMFPNARYFIGDTEHAFWTSDKTHEALQRTELWRLPDIDPMMSEAIRMNVLPLASRIDIIPDNGEPVPGITAIPAFGHTPGHLAFEVDLGDETLIVSGDITLNPVHLENPQCYPAVDLDPATALESRKRLLTRAAESGAIVASYHLPFPGVGRVSNAAEGWTWTPV